MDQTISPEDRDRARLMMKKDLSGDTIVPVGSVGAGDPNLSAEEIAKKRLEARKAMEGVERREDRERREKIIAEKIAKQKEIELIKKRRELAEEERQQENIRRQAEVETAKKTEQNIYQAKVQTAEREINKIKTADSNLKPVHTLSGDIRQANTDINLVRQAIQAKEVRLKQEQAKELTEKSTWLVSSSTIVMSILLVVVGLGLVYFGINKFQDLTTGIVVKAVPSLVLVEHQTEIKIDKKTPAEIFASIDNLTRPTDEQEALTQFYFSETTTTEDGEEVNILTSDDFIATAGINLPTDFIHFLKPDFLAGAYSGGDKTLSNFYIFSTRSFEHTFASLIKNDREITFALFSKLMSASQIDSLQTEQFVDEVINNIDVRLLKNTEGDIILIYAFLDQETLVLTENKESFIKIVNSYLAQKARALN